MQHLIGDIYIGDFPITQSFGARADIYSARYGIRGHNGIDIGCPSLTPILSAQDGYVLEIGFDAGGYGNYLKIVHEGWLSLYAHLNDIVVHKGDRVIKGQLIAHSNNTGFSDAPHLHFGVAVCDEAGNKLEKANGFSGYTDPNGANFIWDIKNLTAPVIPSSGLGGEPIKVDPNDFTNMVSEGSSYKVIVTSLLNKGLNDFLSANGRAKIDLSKKPADPDNGEKVVFYLSSLFSELQSLQNDNRELRIKQETIVSVDSSNLEQVVANMPKERKDLLITNGIKNLLSSIKGFVFEKK